MSKVSIIIPVYNAEKTLERCLESVVSQSYRNIEIIIVNDGSTDGSQKICTNYCQRYSNIQLINQNNFGPATARNIGIDTATGKYISFVDADDYIESNMIEAMLRVAEKNCAEMVICGYYQEMLGKTCIHKFAYKQGLYEGELSRKIAINLINDVSEERIPPYSWIRMVLRNILENPKIRYSSGMIRSEDYYFFVQLHFRINRLYLLTNKPLYHYMEIKESITHSYINGYWDTVKKIYYGLKNKLPDQKDINNRLDIMLIQRSLIALNNSSRCNNIKKFRKEIDEIIEDKLLKSAVDRMLPLDGVKEFGIYYILMKIRANFIILGRYWIKYCKRKVV